MFSQDASELHPRFDPEFLEHAPQVVIDGVPGDEEPPAGLAVTKALTNELSNGPLGVRQFRPPGEQRRVQYCCRGKFSIFGVSGSLRQHGCRVASRLFRHGQMHDDTDYTSRPIHGVRPRTDRETVGQFEEYFGP